MNQAAFTFTDRRGRSWDLSLTLASMRRVGCSDFTEVSDQEVLLIQPTKELIAALGSQAPLLAAVVWAIVKPQADSAQVDEDSFIDGLDGRALEAMKEAFWLAMADFFQDRGTGFSNLIALQKRAVARARLVMEERNLEIEAKVDELVDRAMTNLTREIRAIPGSPSGA